MKRKISSRKKKKLFVINFMIVIQSTHPRNFLIDMYECTHVYSVLCTYYGVNEKYTFTTINYARVCGMKMCVCSIWLKCKYVYDCVYVNFYLELQWLCSDIINESFVALMYRTAFLCFDHMRNKKRKNKKNNSAIEQHQQQKTARKNKSKN